jgi:hypothetical protein
MNGFDTIRTSYQTSVLKTVLSRMTGICKNPFHARQRSSAPCLVEMMRMLALNTADVFWSIFHDFFLGTLPIARQWEHLQVHLLTDSSARSQTGRNRTGAPKVFVEESGTLIASFSDGKKTSRNLSS